jgi:hypothetical protein
MDFELQFGFGDNNTSQTFLNGSLGMSEIGKLRNLSDPPDERELGRGAEFACSGIKYPGEWIRPSSV